MDSCVSLAGEGRRRIFPVGRGVSQGEKPAAWPGFECYASLCMSRSIPAGFSCDDGVSCVSRFPGDMYGGTVVCTATFLVCDGELDLILSSLSKTDHRDVS